MCKCHEENFDCRQGDACPIRWQGVPGPVATAAGIVIGSRWERPPTCRDPSADAESIQSAFLGRYQKVYETPFWYAVDRVCWWVVCVTAVAAMASCVFGLAY